jgi:molybdopterin synthase catalytic subunit
MAKPEPDMTAWLAEAKQGENAEMIGMYLTHNGVVRATPRHTVRAETNVPEGALGKSERVTAVDFSYDKKGLERAIEETLTWEGVYYVRAWLNEGVVSVGGSLMYVMIGADIRPHAISALERLVGHIKSNLVQEKELFAI